MPINAFQQEVGESLSGYQMGKFPSVSLLEGQYCQVEHVSFDKHAADILDFYLYEKVESDWTYMMSEPFSTKEAVEECLKEYEASKNPYFFAIRDKKSRRILGTFSLMRIDPQNRVVEMGRVIYAKELQKTRAATEAQFLIMQYVFEVLKYRRYEWKCDSLNRPSAEAAMRLGFTYEGTFRQAVVYKGRTRDTDWFSIIDQEWPRLKRRFEKWLNPANFDENEKQFVALRDCEEEK